MVLKVSMTPFDLKGRVNGQISPHRYRALKVSTTVLDHEGRVKGQISPHQNNQAT